MPEAETQTDFDIICVHCLSNVREDSPDAELPDDKLESESESDTESCSPIFDEDPEDVEEYIHREIHTWLSFPSNLLRISSSNIESIITADVVAVLMEEWIDTESCAESDREEIADWVAAVVADHLSYHVEVPPRQGGTAELMTPLRRAKLHNKLRKLDAMPQVEQRTPAWFEQRYNLLTASNVYKALGTEAQKNSLIVEKCMPYEEFVADSSKRGGLGIGTAMGWGIKYEPLTAMLYERMNPGTRLGEYGCIVHPEWSFLGASPDGINVEPGSEKYGRMVEIKNIVNRDITGIPLEHYWIQMQVQMEVCDLDECDFVETRFKEFQGGRAEYLNSDNEWKGVVLLLTPTLTVDGEYNMDKKAYYKHFICDNREEPENSTDKWIEEQREICSAEGYNVSEISYWYLDQYSCVLVKRNQEWFDIAVQDMEALWLTVVEERIIGCEHRKPKKRETNRGGMRGCMVVKLEE